MPNAKRSPLFAEDRFSDPSFRHNLGADTDGFDRKGHKKDLSFSHEPFTPPPDLLRGIYQFIDESSSHRTGRELILGAVEAMRVHYADPFSADTLAEIAGMSRFHFFRAFKSHTGRTPYRYLKDIRLEKAAEMLREQSESTITEICFKAGFASHSHFASVFYKKTGMTPREYRLRHGNQKFLIESGEAPSL